MSRKEERISTYLLYPLGDYLYVARPINDDLPDKPSNNLHLALEATVKPLNDLLITFSKIGLCDNLRTGLLKLLDAQPQFLIASNASGTV